MVKFVFKIIVFTTISYCLIHSFANAQSFFGATTNPNNPTMAPGGGNTNPVMSPDDFKNMVNTLGQQNLNALSEQTKQMLKPTPQAGMNQPNNANQAAVSQTAGASANPQPPITSTTTLPSYTTQPSQQQGYTGFGNPNNTGSVGPTNSTSNSGGFNIKY